MLNKMTGAVAAIALVVYRKGWPHADEPEHQRAWNNETTRAVFFRVPALNPKFIEPDSDARGLAGQITAELVSDGIIAFQRLLERLGSPANHRVILEEIQYPGGSTEGGESGDVRP